MLNIYLILKDIDEHIIRHLSSLDLLALSEVSTHIGIQYY